MGQTKVVVALKQHQRLSQAVLALAECVDPAANCSHPLANVQVEPLDKGRIDLIWSKNSNVPRSQSLRSHHHPLRILHSTAVYPILTPNERQQFGWNNTWIGSHCWCLSRDLSMRNSACAMRIWRRKTA